MSQETYRQMKERVQKKFNAFPIGFAFSNQQFEDEMKRLNVKSPKELCSIGAGGFIRKSDKKEYLDLIKWMKQEEEKFLKSEENILDAIIYEMGNHEYQFSYDDEEIQELFDIDWNDERNKKLYKKAKKQYWNLCIENDWF